MKNWLASNCAPLGMTLLVAMALAVLGCPNDPPPPPPPTPAPAPAPTPTGPTTEEWVPVPTRITYDRGSSYLSPEARALLAEAHASMSHRTDIVRVRIEGHADDGGSESRNELLAEERAQGVLDYLVGTLRMPRELFEVQSYGSTRPLTSSTTEADRGNNRRVEFQMLVRRQAAY